MIVGENKRRYHIRRMEHGYIYKIHNVIVTAIQCDQATAQTSLMTDHHHMCDVDITWGDKDMRLTGQLTHTYHVTPVSLYQCR